VHQEQHIIQNLQVNTGREEKAGRLVSSSDITSPLPWLLLLVVLLLLLVLLLLVVLLLLLLPFGR
jgi:hypothetical protein